MQQILTKLTGACAIALALTIACYAQSGQSRKQQIYDLPLPRAVAPGEMLVARITVGPLKPHERIIVRIRNGEIAGTVAPFGAQARKTSGVYTIPLPDAAAKDGQVRLLLEAEQQGSETRAPTSEEVQSITLAWIPATKSGSKD
jgi:hypothetical protein